MKTKDKIEYYKYLKDTIKMKSEINEQKVNDYVYGKTNNVFLASLSQLSNDIMCFFESIIDGKVEKLDKKR